jgi:integrase/recombinase XerD
LVLRHVIILNPALSVRGERYAVVEGKTPEISIPEARTLLKSIDTTTLVGLRDHAILAVLVYTAARAGAVASLKRGDFYRAGEQYMLHFEEKGGKSREIPVRHDLQEILLDYLRATKTPGRTEGHSDLPQRPRQDGPVDKSGDPCQRHLPHDEAPPP